MKYEPNFENETCPVEDIPFLAASPLTWEAIGQPISFVSPVRLAAGLCYKLRGNLVGHHLQVYGCLGFAPISRYFVSGIIVTSETASTS